MFQRLKAALESLPVSEEQKTFYARERDLLRGLPWALQRPYYTLWFTQNMPDATWSEKLAFLDRWEARVSF
jgi:hypothetical protein